MTTNNIKFLGEKISRMEQEVLSAKRTLAFLVDTHLEMLIEAISGVCQGPTSKINEGINALIEDAKETFRAYPDHLTKFKEAVFKEFCIGDDEKGYYIDLSDDTMNAFILTQIKELEKAKGIKIDLSRTYKSTLYGR